MWLGWESCRHVGDMSARQPKVGTFGRLGQVVPTQIRSRHIFLCRGLPTFSKFSLSTRGTYKESSYKLVCIKQSVQPCYFFAPLTTFYYCDGAMGDDDVDDATTTMATARRTAKSTTMATAQRATSTTTMTMATARRNTTTTTMATDVDDGDNEGDDASSTGCDEGDNRNRDDGEDACASATATTQPVVRRRRVERRRRCKEMRRDNQLARTKRRGRGWTRAAAAQRKVTRGGGTRQKAMRQPAGERETNGRRGASRQEAMGAEAARLKAEA